jgi:hypothetical protein
MPTLEFDEKYNQRYLTEDYRKARSGPFSYLPRKGPANAAASKNPFKANGIEKFRDYDFEGAIEDFKKALTDYYEDSSVHFNLACCYSLLEKGTPALFHLDKAVRFGFVDFEKFETHDGLAYLRTRPEYRDFAKNGYQFAPPAPGKEQPVTLQLPAEKDENNLLEQIRRLVELRKSGVLTEEEFLLQQEKYLGK